MMYTPQTHCRTCKRKLKVGDNDYMGYCKKHSGLGISNIMKKKDEDLIANISFILVDIYMKGEFETRNHITLDFSKYSRKIVKLVRKYEKE